MGKGKGKSYGRPNSLKPKNKRKKKTKKYEKSGWKLKFPKIFEEISEFPYIVRIDKKKKERKFKKKWY